MSGISILKKLLMIKAVKDTANMGSGIMTINRSLKSLVDKDVDNYIMSAKKQGVDIDKMNESQIKYMLELNKPKAPKVLSNEEAYAFLNKFLNQGKKGEVVKFPEKAVTDWTKARPTITVESVIEDIKKLEPIESMKEANRVLRGEGKYKNLSKADREKIASDESVTDHIFERNIIDETEDFAGGGIAGMLDERTPYRYGKTYKKRKEEDRIMSLGPMWMGPSIHQREESHQVPDRVGAWGHGVNFPYKSLEDIPPKVLEMLRKDPVFDLETFLKKVAWSDPDKTRIQKRIKGEKEPPWGSADHYGDMMLYKQKFGESEPIGDGLLSIRSPSDADKVQTILHEMRHAKMREPWFWKSSAIPKYVRETDHPHYSFRKYGDKDDDPHKFVGGEELFIRFLDQHFGDVAEKGSLAGSDYKPYFDKILKDHWKPYAKRYEDILKEEKRVKSKPYGLAGGGIAGMLGEPTFQDEEHRVPYDSGKLVEGEPYIPPKNFYGIGLGPLLNEFMSEGKPRDEEGHHTTLSEQDLINLWNYLKEDQDIDLKDELMFRFGRFDPEKKSQFHFGIGKDKAEIGWKKKFNEGGRVPYQDGEFVKKEDLPSGLKAEVGDPTPGWGLSDLVNRYFLYQKVIPGVSEETRKYLGEKFLNDLNAQGYSPKDFKAYIDEQFPGKASGGRVPYNEGGSSIDYGKKGDSQVLPVDFDELGPEELIHIIKLLQAGEIPKFADGGRIGFKNGKGPKMSRRTFLKGLGALAALPVVGKLFKFTKPAAKVSKTLTQVPIQNAEGMPAWFEPLVNRVIKEGNDITKLPPSKGGALAEREIVHSAKLGEEQGVRVTQNLDNQTITVEYQSANNMGGVDDAVYLEYKAAEEVATKKGSVKTKPEFKAEEAWPHGTTGDYKDITMEGSNVVTKVDDLYSDTSALKQFGTNKTLSKKELEIAKQKRQRVNEINNDLGEQNQLLPDPPDYDDFASGGRVPFGKGKTVKGLAALIDEFFPGTTKIGKTSKPMAEKTQLRRAITDFQEREKAAKFKEMIKNKYQGKIDDDLLNKMLVDNNAQRIAEVMATIDEALIMQGKGMGPETIMTTLRDSWKRNKNASGGLAHMVGE